MRKISLLTFLLIFQFSVVRLQAAEPTLNAVRLNKEGAKFLQEQQFTVAQDRFLKALRESPFWSLLYVNLGLTYYGLGQMDKATTSYETAVKLAGEKEPLVRYVAYFNMGEMSGKAKNIPQALESYQKALDVKPDSIEAKTNIELLTKDEQGGGGGENDQDKDKDKDKDKKDDKNQDQKGKEPKDPKDDDKGKEDKPKEYDKNQKPQPPKFKSEELTQGDVNKILGEIKQQEQKIRQDYNKKDTKEQPRDKDW